MVKLAVPEPQSSMHIKERMKASKGGMSLSCCVLPSGFFPCRNLHPQCFWLVTTKRVKGYLFFCWSYNLVLTMLVVCIGFFFYVMCKLAGFSTGLWWVQLLLSALHIVLYWRWELFVGFWGPQSISGNCLKLPIYIVVFFCPVSIFQQSAFTSFLFLRNVKYTVKHTYLFAALCYL